MPGTVIHLRRVGQGLGYLVGFALFSIELFDAISAVAPSNIDYADVLRYGLVALSTTIWVVCAGEAALHRGLIAGR